MKFFTIHVWRIWQKGKIQHDFNFWSLNLCIMFLLLSSQLLFGQEKSSDSIVAIVNDEIITYGDVESKVKKYLVAIDNSPLSPRDKELQKQKILTQALRDLVDEKLTLQEAKRYNISISELTIKERIEEERTSNNRGESGEVDFTELMRARLTLQELFQKKASYSKDDKFRAMIDTFVSPQEIGEYYQKNIQEFTKKPKIKTRTIMLLYSKCGGEEQALARAEEIIKMHQQGKDFAQLAVEYSHGASAQNGGAWPTIEKDGKEVWDFFGEGEALDKEVDAIIFKLRQGEVSSPIPSESSPWCWIIKIEEIQAGGVTSFIEAQEPIRQKLRMDKIISAFGRMRAQLREKAFIWPANLFEDKKTSK